MDLLGGLLVDGLDGLLVGELVEGTLSVLPKTDVVRFEEASDAEVVERVGEFSSSELKTRVGDVPILVKGCSLLFTGWINPVGVFNANSPVSSISMLKPVACLAW